MLICGCYLGPWALSAQAHPYPKCLEVYKWFGVYLLQGNVKESLKQFTPFLLSPPITMIKTWAKLQKRTQFLLAGLVGREVYNKNTLMRVWSEDPQCMLYCLHHCLIYILLLDLLAEYSTWLPQTKHEELSSIWPPIN